MLLSKAFRIQPKQVVALVGGGGKTTAMFQLANELAAQSKRVVTTTTTRIFAAQIKLAPFHLSPSAYLTQEGWGDSIRNALASHPHTLIIGETQDDGKALGVAPELVDELIALDPVDAVIYEADGSRMRPFKAPAEHEPVIATSTTLLVPIVGISAVGALLDDERVHRPEVVARIIRAAMESVITPEMVAKVVAHPEGGLKNKPRDARVIALVNQVETQEQLAAAREIAQRLLRNDAIEAVTVGAVEKASNPVIETHRRVAAIIAAAGAGTRMQGRIKQLLPWRGKTLIENAIELATQSEANEIILILGAHAEKIKSHLASLHQKPKENMRVIFNGNWEEGHSSTIHAALAALPPQTDAALFINADQPLLTPDVVNEIIRRYRATAASIVVPIYAGKRASPVLFQRQHFDELRALRGEQGGRELIQKHLDLVEWVEFEDAQLGVDVDTIDEYESLK